LLFRRLLLSLRSLFPLPPRCEGALRCGKKNKRDNSYRKGALPSERGRWAHSEVLTLRNFVEG
jgi:hypothetical protein